MLIQYIQAALEHAKYEIIDDEESYYGEVPELQGVWASGKTLEECRKNLEDVLDEWIIIRLRKGLTIPLIGNINITSINFDTPAFSRRSVTAIDEHMLALQQKPERPMLKF